MARVYTTSFEDGVWRMRRDQNGFQQRFEAHLSESNREMHGAWDKKTGDDWERDFEVLYTRQI